MGKKGKMPEDLVTTGTENAGSTAVASGANSGSTGTGTGGGQPSPITAPAGSALASLQKVSAAASSAANLNSNADDPQNRSAAGTTVQPGQPGANSGAQGEDASWLAIPEARREVILKNTREKAKEEALREVESTYGWAKDLSRDSVSEAFNFASSINQNPVGFAVQLVSELLDHPQGRAALMQHLGPLFAGGREQPGGQHQFRSQDGRFTLPEGRLTDETGKHRAYSGEQMVEILSNFESHLEEKFGSRVQPLEDHHASMQEREQVMEIVRASREEGTSLMTEMRALAHWPQDGPGKAGEQKIAQYLAAIPPQVKKQIGAYGSMMRAFNTYKEKDVYPTLAGNAQQQVRDDLRRKAAAGTGTVAPNGQGVTTPAKKPTNVHELARHMERMAGGSAQ